MDVVAPPVETLGLCSESGVCCPTAHPSTEFGASMCFFVLIYLENIRGHKLGAVAPSKDAVGLHSKSSIPCPTIHTVPEFGTSRCFCF